MKYPVHILPETNYKLQFDLSSLISDQRVCLTRRSNFGTVEETFDKFGMLKERAIEPRFFPNCSMNLLGGKFGDKDTCWRQTGDAMKPWNGEEIIFQNFDPECFTLLSECPVIFIDANALHKRQFEYTLPNDKNIKKKLEQFFPEGIEPDENNKFNVQGRTEFKHSPNKSNYWHTEMEILAFDDGAIKKYGSTWVKNLCENLFSKYLKINCANSEYEYELISEEVYMDE